MKKMTLPKVAFAALAVAGMMTFTATKSDAISDTFDASVEIVDPLSFDKKVDLFFGKVVRPTLGTTAFTLAPTGPLIVTAVGADGQAVPSSGAAVGEFDVKAGGAVDVNLTAIPGGPCDTGVSLTDIQLDPGTGATPLFSVAVGGTVEVTDAASNGVKNCTYTVETSFP